MILDEEQVNLRLDSPDNLINKLLIKPLHNSPGPRGIPPMVQTLAVALGQIDSQPAAAKAFGMAQQNVSYLTHHGKNIDRDFVKEKVTSAHSSALDAMLESISLLGPKLKDVKKASELARIADNMASVVNKTTPHTNTPSNLVVVAYAPRMKDEAEFEQVITVNSNQ
jgi:hypothetical protein